MKQILTISYFFKIFKLDSFNDNSHKLIVIDFREKSVKFKNVTG